MFAYERDSGVWMGAVAGAAFGVILGIVAMTAGNRRLRRQEEEGDTSVESLWSPPDG